LTTEPEHVRIRPVTPETPPAAGETIGQRLKRLRLARGLSQRELAAPGVSYAYISRIEAGTRQPSVKALRKLAGKLGVSADFLETGSELDPSDARELRLADLELAIRLGEADGAEDAVLELLTEATAAADGQCAFRARLAAATIREAQDDLPGAIQFLEEALADEPFAPSERVDVYGHLARVYAASGRTREAADLLEACLDRSTGNPSAETRYAVLLSYALTDLGEIGRAEEVVRTALEHTRDTEDPYMRVRLYWSLARLADAEGRGSLALRNIRKAIALLESTEDALNLARAHMLAGRILVERSSAGDAEVHLDNAERLLGATPANHDLVEVKVQRSRLACIRSDGESAVELAREALELDPPAPDRGEALAALADGLALRGETDEANDTYREGIRILEGEGRWRPAAAACRSWARMLRDCGRERDALDVLERAAELGMRAAPQHAHAER
jgi:transcriptional regulator with XRE-family HTH domain